jgi:hypothetical protein
MSCAARLPDRQSARLNARSLPPRRVTCRVRHDHCGSSRRERCCVGTKRSSGGSGARKAADRVARSSRPRSNNSCFGSLARTRAGSLADMRRAGQARPAGITDKHPSAACSCPAAPGAATRWPELARVSAPAGGEHRRLRFLYGRDRSLTSLLRSLLHRAQQSPRSAWRLYHQPGRQLGYPTGTQPRPLLRRAADPLPDPRPRQQVHRPVRRDLPQRAHPDLAHTSPRTEGQRRRRALRPHRPLRVPRLAPHPQPPTPRASPPNLFPPLQHPAPTPRARPVPPRASSLARAAKIDRHTAPRQTRRTHTRVLPGGRMRRDPSNGTLHAAASPYSSAHSYTRLRRRMGLPCGRRGSRLESDAKRTKP